MDELFYSLLINFCVAGGLGFTNDYILEKLDVINTSDTNSKKFSLIFFSLVNFTIFYFIDIHLKNFYLSTIITFIISLALTFTLFWWTINLVRNELNFLREKRGLGHVEHRTVRKLVLDRNDPYFVYAYDLKSKELLTWGGIGWISSDFEKDFEFEIKPLNTSYKLSYEEAINIASNEKYVDDSSIFINVDKQIQIVIIPYKTQST